MLPYALDFPFTQIGIAFLPFPHEVARTKCGVLVAQFMICQVNDVGYPFQMAELIRVEPAAQQSLNRLLVRSELYKSRNAAAVQDPPRRLTGQPYSSSR